MYKLYINSESPFSMKASAMIGYAGLRCEPKIQNLITRFATLERLTGQTMVPTLRRGEWAINDSTQIARHVMQESQAPLLPRDEALEPLCWLLEDFADEWVSLWVLGSRYHHAEDARHVGSKIGRELVGGLPLVGPVIGRLATPGIKRVIERRGAHPDNETALERSRERLLQALEQTLEDEPEFLFERYPTVADFALYGQLVQYLRDPTGRQQMRLYPNVREYVERIDRMTLPHPRVAIGEDTSGEVSRLSPLLAEFLGTYWRVLVANHRALNQPKRPEKAAAELLDGSRFERRPSSYLVERLEFVLSQLDRAYAAREEMFGGKGLEIEHALVQQLSTLTEYAAGRQLLRRFGNIAKV